MQRRTVLLWLIKALFLVGVIISVNYFVVTKYINNIEVPTNKEIIRDSLVRDTLYRTKDSLTTTIINVKESYEKEKAIIIANDSTADMQFFTNYINYYNNSRTTKDN